MTNNRKEFWQQHEQSSDTMEKARAKPVVDKTTKIWQKACSDYLTVNPFCSDCAKRGYKNPAERVSHIEFATTQVKFWDVRNWQALCLTCDRRNTPDEDIIFHEPIYSDVRLYKVKA